jgi:antitoxin ParD1/3/4
MGHAPFPDTPERRARTKVTRGLPHDPRSQPDDARDFQRDRTPLRLSAAAVLRPTAPAAETTAIWRAAWKHHLYHGSPGVSLAEGRPSPILVRMSAVILPPDLERFADDAVAQGRFRDVAEVVRAGISLLQHAEAERVAFVASLEAAEAESERDGFVTAEQVHREMNDLIEEMDRARR